MVVSAYVFDVGVEYTENVEQVSALIAEILVELKNDPVFGPTIVGDPEIFGVDRFVEFSFVIRGRIRTLPGNQWAAGREFLRRVKMSFERNNIKIPLPHRTLMLADQVLLPAAESVLKKRSTPPTL